MSFVKDAQKVLKENIREYGMYIALFVIMALFTIATNGVFLSSRNLSNLINQTGYIAVLTVGMTMVIVIRHIDLSVGSLAGFLGALVAISMVFWHWPLPLSILFCLVIGVLAGALIAFLVTQLGIPAFVASMAGWLAYRGALLLVTMGTGTIIIPNDTFNAIGNGFLPDFPLPDFLPGLHKLTLLIGLIGIVLFIYGELNNRAKKLANNFEVLPTDMFILKLILISAIIGTVTWVLAGFRGISWTLVIVMVVVALFHFITTQTVLGRHIYAVGGNPEAAQLSGIDVKKITYFVFGSMGGLAALSGILFASRLQSATTTAGNLFEMDAIAAAYVGGVSAAGGVGKVFGSIIGALVMMSLTSGMNLMQIDISIQYIVRGLVLAVAVIFDVTTRNRGK